MNKYHFDLTGLAIHDDTQVVDCDGRFDTESSMQFDIEGLGDKAVRERAHKMFDKLLDKIFPQPTVIQRVNNESTTLSAEDRKYFEKIVEIYGEDIPAQVLRSYILELIHTQSKNECGLCGESGCPCSEG